MPGEGASGRDSTYSVNDDDVNGVNIIFLFLSRSICDAVVVFRAMFLAVIKRLTG